MADFEALWLAEPDHRRQAGGAAARALRDDPADLAVSGDPFVRLDMGFGLFTGMTGEMAEPPAGAKRGDCVLAVAAFQPPGACISTMLPPPARQLDEPGPDAGDLDRWLHVGSVMAVHDLPDEHWHVGPVGVEPGFQGRGLGHAVMRLLCDRFDARGDVGWLETDKVENVRFYVSLGFEVVEEVPVLGDRFRWWFMRRDPR